MRTSNISPSEIKNKLASWSHVANQIINGLNGKPFSWCGGEFEAYRPKAKMMGITLVTKSQVTRMGYRLKRDAQPVGNGYFRSPISRSADLYVLECQAVKENTNDQTT